MQPRATNPKLFFLIENLLSILYWCYKPVRFLSERIKMPLNQSQVAQIVVLAQEGYTQRQLAERSQTSQSAVYRVL
jgi:DNA-binding MarR family transcriptional regulator